MREIDYYNQHKEKLNGICDENNLTCSIQQKYPFLLTIKPTGGTDAQQTMMEGMDSGSETGYISSDASLVFAYRDGVLTYKISETWTIGDSLFNKLKNTFKKLHLYWMMHFFRDYHENGVTKAVQEEADSTVPLAPELDNIVEALEPGPDAEADDVSDVEVDDETLAEFFDNAEEAAQDPNTVTVNLSELD